MAVDPSAHDNRPVQRPWVSHARSIARNVAEVLVVSGVLYLIISTLFQTVRVEGLSMVPTLQDQDFLVASKIAYHFGEPQRGDIITLIPPLDRNRDFIKRIIATPGDTIEIDGSQHPTELLIKPGGSGPWQKVEEPYLPPNDPWDPVFCCDSNGMARTTTATPFTLPAGKYFVMGDNRNVSSDSRFFGLVARNDIIAKAFFRLGPLSHFGFLGTGPTLIPATSILLTPFPIAWRRRRFRKRLLGNPTP